ncbi:hypothetical protein KP509_11G084900 [Ceratopteris richardii]|uniref:Oligopeptide transporter 4 n=1 Tax=Ceratopteris richardii TaxID=49495 RepID=A0A8T2TWY7_CERRI|nr:hypothetical protein KP509_11G084900 [Ceratopteris richardii]
MAIELSSRRNAPLAGCCSPQTSTYEEQNPSGSANEKHQSSSVGNKEYGPHPIEQVRMTVAETDDASLPVWTVRMWVLGIASCTFLAFINQLFQYRSEPMKITALSATLAALPLGHAMAFLLPDYTVWLRIPFRACRPLTFSLNPGPFNVKEHVLIAIFANAGNAFGYGGAFALEMVNLAKIFFGMRITFYVGLVLVLSSQMIGYGWAGLMRKKLINSAVMWWPSTMVQVSLFRTLHETNHRGKISLQSTTTRVQLRKDEWQRRMSRSQVFYVITVASFAYYVIPGYFIPWLTCISLLCLLCPNSVLAQQIGSGFKGLGIGAFTMDWAAVSSFLGSPLVFPAFVLVNMTVGAGLVLYVVTPLLYYGTNSYKARNFPIFSSSLFTEHGQRYNVTVALLHPENPTAIQGDLYLSVSFAVIIALLFAAPISTVTHFLLFHGKETFQSFWPRAASKDQEPVDLVDVHTHLMKRYPDIPKRWFVVLLVLCIVGVMAISVPFKDQVQIPWWGILLGCTMAALLTLPVGVIMATTNMSPSLMVLMQFIGGYIFPGNPIANQGLKLFGHMSMQQAIFFLQDFKLGHYMKIPPRMMFAVQVIGTIIAGTVDMGTAWWLYNSVPHLCNADGKSDVASAWTCPWDIVAYDTSIVWGVLGPDYTFGSKGVYKNIAFYMLLGGGVLAPLLVWLLAKIFPNASPWIKLINVPVILGASGWMPAASSINYTSWLCVGFIFNYYVFKYHKTWWKEYNFVISAALDAGTTIMGLFISISFMGQPGGTPRWWGSSAYSDHCRLSNCPLDSTRSSSLSCEIYN